MSWRFRRDGAAWPRCCKRGTRGQRRLRARGIPRRTGRLIGCVDRGWPEDRAFPGPGLGKFVLLTDTHLILEPTLYRCGGCECRADFRHTLGEVFLNASMASAFC